MELEMKNENVVLGIIGAVLGAMVGSIGWLLLDQFGVIAAIAGFAIVYCSIKGYMLLGQEISKRGLVICIIICILMIPVVDYVSLGIYVFREFSAEYDITIYQAFASLPYFFEEPEVVKTFGWNLFLGYAFVVLGSFSSVKKLWKGLDQLENNELHN